MRLFQARVVERQLIRFDHFFVSMQAGIPAGRPTVHPADRPVSFVYPLDAMHDLAIIGAGPAGLSAALAAQRLGIDVVVIERGHVAETVRQYPIGKPLFSTADELELAPGTLAPRGPKPTREELLTHYSRFVVDSGLDVRTGVRVIGIRRDAGAFVIETETGSIASRTVLVSTGINGFRKRLDVPGETPERVQYSYSEGYPYAGKDVLVVGSGNSAAETALFLEEVGARVTLAMRRSGYGSDTATGKAEIKWWIANPLRELETQGRMKVLFDATVESIADRTARIAIANSTRVDVACDAIFALLGTRPDLSLFESAGVRIDADGLPAYDPATFETNVPGLYVAGHITREPHMKGALRVGPLVARRIADTLSAIQTEV